MEQLVVRNTKEKLPGHEPVRRKTPLVLLRPQFTAGFNSEVCHWPAPLLSSCRLTTCKVSHAAVMDDKYVSSGFLAKLNTYSWSCSASITALHFSASMPDYFHVSSLQIGCAGM